MIRSGSRAATSVTKSHSPLLDDVVDDLDRSPLHVVLQLVEHPRGEAAGDDPALLGVPGVVHVDDRAEELQELLGHVTDVRAAPARAEQIGAPAGLDDVGVAGERVVARALGQDHEIRLLEELDRFLGAHQVEGGVALGPRPGPERRVREVDVVQSECHPADHT